MSVRKPIIFETLFRDLVDLFEIASPIEEEFYRVISKCLSHKTELQNQYKITVGKYRFRIDFVVIFGDLKIGFECDGKDYHNFIKDKWRDEVILASGGLAAIIRLRGTDINFRCMDVLFVVASWYPELFSDRGIDIINRLSTDISKKYEIGKDYAHFSYPPGSFEKNGCEVDDPLSDGFGTLFVERRIK